MSVTGIAVLAVVWLLLGFVVSLAVGRVFRKSSAADAESEEAVTPLNIEHLRFKKRPVGFGERKSEAIAHPVKTKAREIA